MLWELAIPIFLVSFQHEGGDGADRAEREAMHRSHSQLPYFLGRPAQEHTVIKSGYCVKQGAVVSACRCHGSLLGSVGFTLPPGKVACAGQPHRGHAVPFMINYFPRKLHESPEHLFPFSPQMRNWKRRYFLLEENSMSYFKSDLVINFD